MPEAPIIVCGMARSGTGLVTQILEKLGIYMGGRYITDNRESITFKDLNRQMLDSFGCTWRNPLLLPSIDQLYTYCDWMVEHHKAEGFDAVLNHSFFDGNRDSITRWGWKDPRNSLTLPIWHRVFPNATAIHVRRDAKDVALSNVINDWSRESFNPDYHYNGERRRWYQRYIELNSFYLDRISNTLPRFDSFYVIDYEDILAEPRKEVTELAEFLDLPPEPVEEAALIVDPTRVGQHRRRGLDLSFTEEAINE